MADIDPAQHESCFLPPLTPPPLEMQKSQLFKSPLEKFIESQREKLASLKEKERKLSTVIQDYRISKVSDKRESGPLCGNCHRRERHNRLNCPYEKCLTSFHCGEIEKHSEEKSMLKDLERQQKDVQKEISSLVQDLKLKEGPVASIQNRYIYKVRKCLVESNPNKYLTVGKNGSVENWYYLNRDAKKLEHICKGTVPPPGTDIQKLLDSKVDTTINPSVVEQQKTRVRNPYRKLWEDRGVVWPSTNTVTTCTNTSTSQSSSTNYEQLIPSTPQASSQPELTDDYLLALGIQESLKNMPSKSLSDNQTTPSTSSTSDKPFSGLSVLLDACEKLQEI